MYQSGAWQRDGETWDGGSLTQCATGAMRPLLGSHKVMCDLALGTPMSQSHRNAVARTPGSIYRATSPDAEDPQFKPTPPSIEEGDDDSDQSEGGLLMRRLWMGIAAVLELVIGNTTTSWTGSIEPQSGKGVFAGLKVGQPVTLKDGGCL